MKATAPSLLLKAAVLILLTARQVSAQCTFGSVITEVGDPSPFYSGQQYMNLDNPSPCSGNITAWHFCYFLNQDDSFNIEFRVWRASGQGRNSFEELHNDQRSIVPNGSAINSTQLNCVDITLTREEYLRVEQDDVIGVYVPLTASISPVGVFDSPPAGTGVRRDDRSIITILISESFQRNDLSNLPNSGLYLYADIAPAVPIVATTVPPISQSLPTPEVVSSTGTTSGGDTVTDGNEPIENVSDGNSSQSGNKTEVAAAVVIVLLLLIGVGVIAAFIVIFVYLRKKNKSLICCCERKENGFFTSFDNLIYRVGSDRIPFHTGRKQESLYDVPRDQHKRTLYDIPKSLSPSLATSTNSAVTSHSVIETSTPPSDGLQTLPTNFVKPSLAQAEGNVYEEPINISNQVQTNVFAKGIVDDPEYIYMCTSPVAIDGDEARKFDHRVSSEEESDSNTEEYISINFDSVEYKKLLKKATDDKEEGTEPHYLVPPSKEDEIYMFLSKQRIKIIPRKAITKVSYLGAGEFATVDKGVWEGSKGERDVAVKTLSKNVTEDEKICFLQEAVTMSQFVHPNIVQLYGVVTRGDPIMLVLEHMPKGDLKRYLNSIRPPPGELVSSSTPRLLLGFSQQVALGMHYLASKGFVHRDLAARNVFVSEDNNCKIGDFGRSKDMKDGFYKGHGGKVPLKWTAPEAIRLKKYSTASDVWSYGCLLYEIWSLGRKPFKGVSNTEAINKISNGYRLPPPPGCSKIVYDLMIRCWHPSPATRPKYREILTVLLGEEYRVLSIPTEDASTSAQASLLGAPIEEGEKMYLDLQGQYLADFNSKRNSDYEYVNTDNEDLQV